MSRSMEGVSVIGLYGDGAEDVVVVTGGTVGTVTALVVVGWLVLVMVSAVVCTVAVSPEVVAFGRFEPCFLAILSVCVRFPESFVLCLISLCPVP
jgi:hypothetical protein